MCSYVPGGPERLPNCPSPVFPLGFSPRTDSLLANYLGDTSNITMTSRQRINLNTKLCMSSPSFGGKLDCWGLKKTKNEFNKNYFYIFLYSFLLKPLPFACNENHTNAFTESILRNRRKHDSKTVLVHILLFVISSLLMCAFLTSQNSNSQASMKKTVQKNSQPWH